MLKGLKELLSGHVSSRRTKEPDYFETYINKFIDKRLGNNDKYVCSIKYEGVSKSFEPQAFSPFR